MEIHVSARQVRQRDRQKRDVLGHDSVRNRSWLRGSAPDERGPRGQIPRVGLVPKSHSPSPTRVAFVGVALWLCSPGLADSVHVHKSNTV